MTDQTAEHNPQRIALALQGGGAHGAYSRGLVEELLASRRFIVSAVSGTSAGALNGAALVQGLARAGAEPKGKDWAENAARPIAQLWDAVGATSPLRSIDFGGIDPLDSFANAYDLMFDGARALSGFVSAQSIGAKAFRELRRLVEQVIDVNVLKKADIPLFVAATNVRTGALKLFLNRELSHDALLASACLPDFFPTVEIDGEAYWDGGFVGNPPLMPLVEIPASFDDLVVLQVTPFVDENVPRTPQSIISRVTEITFSASLQSDLALLDRVRDSLTDVEPASHLGQRIKQLRVHVVAPHEAMGAMPTSSKFDTRPSHLEHLRQLGRERAQEWLASEFSVLETQHCGVTQERQPFRSVRDWLRAHGTDKAPPSGPAANAERSTNTRKHAK